MKQLLFDSYHNYISAQEREFLLAFESEMEQLGFEKILIGDFARWGSDTVAFIKPHVKTRDYIVKIMFDGQTVQFRIYCRNVQKHQAYIEASPQHIREIFTSSIGNCEHCSAVGGCVKPDGRCSHRKTYTIDGIRFDKCDGKVFYVTDFSQYPVADIIALIKELRENKAGKSTAVK